jgi:hypothetical protein
MSEVSYIHVLSREKLAFPNTVCTCCGQNIPIEQNINRFLSKVQGNAGRAKIDRDGILTARDYTLFFSEFDYTSSPECVESNKYRIGMINIGNYTNFEDPYYLGKGLSILDELIELLYEFFPDQTFYYKAVAGSNLEKILIPLSKIRKKD